VLYIWGKRIFYVLYTLSIHTQEREDIMDKLSLKLLREKRPEKSRTFSTKDSLYLVSKSSRQHLSRIKKSIQDMVTPYIPRSSRTFHICSKVSNKQARASRHIHVPRGLYILPDNTSSDDSKNKTKPVCKLVQL